MDSGDDKWTAHRTTSTLAINTNDGYAFRDTWPGWATVESEPGIFTSLIRAIGVKGLSVEEIYSLDEASLESFKPLHGLIFLFRWKDETKLAGVKKEEIWCPDGIWFANQVVENACASLALLNIILNIDEIELGDHLSQFKDFTKDFSPPLRGLALTNFEYLRKLHNSFARKSEMMDSDLALMDSMKSHKSRKRKHSISADDDDDNDGLEEECFHFIAYIYRGGHVWELDGIKRAPVKLDVCSQSDWTRYAAPQIQARMARYNDASAAASHGDGDGNGEEIRFSLLGVCADPSVQLRAKRDALNAEFGRADPRCHDYGHCHHLDHHPEQEQEQEQEQQQKKHDIPDYDFENMKERNERLAEIRSVETSLADLAGREETYKRYAARRRHEYMPFTTTFLEILHRKDLLRPFLS